MADVERGNRLIESAEAIIATTLLDAIGDVFARGPRPLRVIVDFPIIDPDGIVEDTRLNLLIGPEAWGSILRVSLHRNAPLEAITTLFGVEVETFSMKNIDHLSICQRLLNQAARGLLQPGVFAASNGAPSAV